MFPTVNTLQVFLAEVCDERPEKTQLIGVCEEGCHGELEKPVPRGPRRYLFEFFQNISVLRPRIIFLKVM